ncbi:MAG: MFS transporter [Candidatus Kariarchaeaceae archaeon]|jgi:DHA3 family macrolide efflux protein-like MFS transporter
MIEENNDLKHPTADSASLKQYWFFLSGQLLSLLGSSIVQFAMIWWIAVISQDEYPGKSGFILGLAAVLGFGPTLVTSLFAGVYVDRWNRKLVIAIADFSQAIVTAVLIVLFYLDQATLIHVLLILTLRAVAQGFHGPATEAIIPLLVPKEKLTEVNSVGFLFNGVIFLIGPVIGALLVEFFGVENLGTILLVDVFTFIAAIIPVLLIHIPDITKEKRESEDKPSFRSEFQEGVGFIREKKGLLSLLTTFTVANILGSPIFVLLPLIVLDPDLLDGNASTLAIIIAVSQVGSILGAFIMSKWMLFKNNVHGVVIGQSIFYISLFIAAASAIMGNIYGVWLAFAINGFSNPLMNVCSQTIWQSVVPLELQGRVMSVRSVIAWLFIPVSQLLAGILADFVGAVYIILVAPLFGGIFLVYAWFMTGLPIVEQTLGLESPEEMVPQEPIISSAH